MISAVSYEEQALTIEQQAQARENIGAQPIGDYALKSDIPDISSTPTIIDVIELPTENINENTFYRLLHGSLVVNQIVLNSHICHCVESLPTIGLPAGNIDYTEGHFYYNVSNGELYGYVDDILSAGLGVPSSWYPAATLLGALDLEYSGVITNILDDPKDDTFRLLLEYIIYSYKSGWTSQKTIGWAGTGPSSEVFNHLTNIASGMCSHAEGYFSHAEGDHSHAEGYFSHAEGDHSHAEGYFSHAEGNHSHAEGNHSHAEGYFSHAEGNQSHAEGLQSHAEGNHSHAEGDSSHAEGYCSHAEGYSSHAEGKGFFDYKIISGSANSIVYTINDLNDLIVGASIRHVIYNNNNVPTYNTAKIISIDTINKTITVNRTLSADTDINGQSVSVYVNGLALGDNSHSEGNQTIAAGRSQHTQGEFNIIDPDYDVNDNNKRGKYAHIVGNGSSHTSRSNAHTLDWEGNAWFQGDVYLGGTGQDDENAVRLAKVSEIPDISGLASESYVANKIAEKINEDELSTIINDALFQAKISGEFNGKDGADGKTPVRGTDYWTPADQEAIVQQVIAALGTPVFGRVDGENNIILTGELADGTYTIKYEDADGNVTEIGTIDTTSAPSYTNWIPKSTGIDGSIYNGKGYKENTRWSLSGGGDVDATGVTVSGYIPVKTGDVIRIKNITMNKNVTDNSCVVCYFWSRTATDGASANAADITNYFNGVFDASGNLTEFTIDANSSLGGVKYIRLNTGYIGADSILTINEEISGSTPAPAPTYTNLFVPETCTLNKRTNSSGNVSDNVGGFLTDFIDLGDAMASGDTNVLHYKNMYFYSTNLKNSSYAIVTYLTYYDNDKKFLKSVVQTDVVDILSDKGDYTKTLDASLTSARFIRLSAVLVPNPSTVTTITALTSKDQLANCKIALNETITD